MSEDSEQYGTATMQREEPWTKAYFGAFGRRLDADEVDAIEKFVKHAVRDLKPWETTKAVRRCAMQSGKQARRFPPTGEDIVRAIYAARDNYRERMRAESSDHVCATMTQDPRCNYRHTLTHYASVPAREWQRQLIEAADGYQRGNIVCLPVSDKHQAERIAFCRHRGLDVLDARGSDMLAAEEAQA